MGTYIINLGLLMYPGLTTRIFSVFRCFKVQGVGWFLEKDFSIQCFDSSTHQTLLALGVAGLVVYVAGFPLFLLFEMGRNLEHLHVKDPALKNALESHNARSKASEEIVELKFNTRHLQEQCSNALGQVTNDYWVDSQDGTVRQSRQWAGPYIGYLRLRRLK